MKRPPRLDEHRDALLEMARQRDELTDSWQKRMEKKHVEPGGSAETTRPRKGTFAALVEQSAAVHTIPALRNRREKRPGSLAGVALCGPEGSTAEDGGMRKSLGKLTGRGRVIVHGKPVGSISYRIDVWHDNPPHGRKGAEGWAEGDSAVLQAALMPPPQAWSCNTEILLCLGSLA
jgi:hypothetical protein